MSGSELAKRVDAFLRELVIGSLDPEQPLRGLRRMRPEADESEEPTVHVVIDQAPMPELHGERVSIPLEEGGEMQAVLADIIPLESARARAEGETVRIEFAFCDSYPVGRVPDVPNIDPTVMRVVTLPGDPRRELWMSTCLELLYAHLGDDAYAANFEVEWVSDTFEALQKLELTLPES